MTSILTFMLSLLLIVSFLCVIKYFTSLAIDSNGIGLFERALKAVSCALAIVSAQWLIIFIWLMLTGFVRMKVSLWVRELYFTIQEGRLLELLLS